MTDKRKYINRGSKPIRIGEHTVKPGSTVELTESLWESADKESQLYRELTEDGAGRIELVK